MNLAQVDHELAAVVAQVRSSLVRIGDGGKGAAPRRIRAASWSPQGPAIESQTPRSFSGAGTLWHPRGLVVTSAHVIKGRSPSVTLSDGRTFPARLLVRDRALDLAVVAVKADGLPAIALGESTALRPGELVLAAGHPWGVEGAVTAGVVIGVGLADDAGIVLDGGEWRGLRRSDREWITASLRVRPGHSGGPLVDVRGRLVGINTIMAGPGVGVAVPVHVVKRFLRQRLGRSPALA